MNKHGDFIWYELMTTDADAAQKFYGDLISWSFADSGQQSMDYRLFAADGPAVGGLMGLTAEMLSNGAHPMWAGYIGVDDVDASIEALEKAGGKVLLPAWNIPDVGRLAFVTDPLGAPFYIMRDSTDQVSESFATHNPRHGHCGWNELMTNDVGKASTFYGDVFGWIKSDSMDMGSAGVYEMFKNGADRDFMFGGMMRKPDEMPMSMWTFYFRVLSIGAAEKFIKDNGGQTVNGPMEIPGGEFVLNAVDPQGAMFSLLGAE